MNWDKAEELLKKWLEEKMVPKGTNPNSFEWKGFRLNKEEINQIAEFTVYKAYIRLT